MSRRTLCKRFKVVSCQLARLRLFPTDQAMMTPLDTDGRNMIEVIAGQLPKANLPTLVNLWGNVRDMRLLQPPNAC